MLFDYGMIIILFLIIILVSDYVPDVFFSFHFIFIDSKSLGVLHL